MRKVGLFGVVVLCVASVVGCNGQQDAIKAQGIIAAVFKVAVAEEAVVPPADQAAFTNWVSLGQTLNAQLAVCISNVSGIMGTGAKFASCFTTFTSGLLAPAELAQLRILSPSTQQRVQLYVTAVVAGVNIVVAFIAPTITPTPTPTSQLRGLGHQIGLSDADLARAGL
jgi:hypothetical protein